MVYFYQWLNKIFNYNYFSYLGRKVSYKTTLLCLKARYTDTEKDRGLQIPCLFDREKAILCYSNLTYMVYIMYMLCDYIILT